MKHCKKPPKKINDGYARLPCQFRQCMNAMIEQCLICFKNFAAGYGDIDQCTLPPYLITSHHCDYIEAPCKLNIIYAKKLYFCLTNSANGGVLGVMMHYFYYCHVECCKFSSIVIIFL